MTAHPTLQHDDVSRHLLVLSMAKLWKGGAAEALCRLLSLFGMCTSVRNNWLGSLMTRNRKLSHEHGPATSATSHRRRRRIVQSDVQSASNWQWLRPRRADPANRLDAYFGLSAQITPNGGLFAL